jgi:hypothetical protein
VSEGDLNPHAGEISLVRGNHATKVTRAEPARTGIPRSVRCLPCHLCLCVAAAAGAVRLLCTADLTAPDDCAASGSSVLRGAQRPGCTSLGGPSSVMGLATHAQAPASGRLPALWRSPAEADRSGRSVRQCRADLPNRGCCPSAYPCVASLIRSTLDGRYNRRLDCVIWYHGKLIAE